MRRVIRKSFLIKMVKSPIVILIILSLIHIVVFSGTRDVPYLVFLLVGASYLLINKFPKIVKLFELSYKLITRVVYLPINKFSKVNEPFWLAFSFLGLSFLGLSLISNLFGFHNAAEIYADYFVFVFGVLLAYYIIDDLNSMYSSIK